MSTTHFTPSRRPFPSGVFLLLLLLIATLSRAEEIPDICLAGYPALAKQPAEEIPYTLSSAEEEPQLIVRPAFQHWLSKQSWREGYSLWQQSRQCSNALIAGNACAIIGAPVPIEEKCGGTQDGYEFLVMHRYLVQTIKGLWPELEKPLSSWKTFPRPEDYPEEIQNRVYAWPDAVTRAAAAVNAISKAKSQQVLQRWPTEGAFGRWLQCGADKGLGVDTLHGALLTNVINRPADDPHSQPHLLDLYLFWQAHSWIDLAWEKYRRAVGKLPDEPQLQAALIQQCRIYQFWTRQPAPEKRRVKFLKTPLYKNGHFNPAYRGRIARVMGAVEEIKTGKNGRIHIRIDPLLLGVNSLWISSNTPLNIDPITVGSRFYFLGTVIADHQLDDNAADVTQSPSLLQVIAIQTVK